MTSRIGKRLAPALVLLGLGLSRPAQAQATTSCEGPAMLAATAPLPGALALPVPEVLQVETAWCWSAVTISMAKYYELEHPSQCGLAAAAQWSLWPPDPPPPACECAADGNRLAEGCPAPCLSPGHPELTLVSLTQQYSPAAFGCEPGSGALSWDRLRQEIASARRPFIAWWEWLSCEPPGTDEADRRTSLGEATATGAHMVVVSGFSATLADGLSLEIMDPSGVEETLPYDAYVGACLHQRRHLFSIHDIRPETKAERDRSESVRAEEDDGAPTIEEYFQDRLRRQRLSQAKIDAMIARAPVIRSPFPPPRGGVKEREVAVLRRPGRALFGDPLAESRLDVVALAAYRPSQDPQLALSARTASIWPTSPRSALDKRAARGFPRPAALLHGPGLVMTLEDGVVRSLGTRTARWTSAVARGRARLAARDGVSPQDIAVIDCRPLNRTYVGYRTPRGVMHVAAVSWMGGPELGPTERASTVFARLAPEATALLRHGRPIF